MSRVSINNTVAIEPVPFSKIESKIEGGIARISQKIDLVKVKLIMGVHLTNDPSPNYLPGDYAILRGDSGLQPWNKAVYELDGQKLVICPINQVIGFEREV
jgi:hypothetical protein